MKPAPLARNSLRENVGTRFIASVVPAVRSPLARPHRVRCSPYRSTRPHGSLEQKFCRGERFTASAAHQSLRLSPRQKICSSDVEHAPGGVSHLAHSWAGHVGAAFMPPACSPRHPISPSRFPRTEFLSGREAPPPPKCRPTNWRYGPRSRRP